MIHTIEKLQQWRDTRRRYLMDCFEQEDWHGVMDAAADLREIDVELEIALWLEKERQPPSRK